MSERTKALSALTRAITELAEIARDLDSGHARDRKYELIADLLEKARGHITQAEAFEL